MLPKYFIPLFLLFIGGSYALTRTAKAKQTLKKFTPAGHRFGRHSAGNKGYNFVEQMDNHGVYNLSWTVKNDIVEFYIEAKTTGWVGLGVSPSGGMVGADIFVGGVKSDGTTYGADYHAPEKHKPILDKQQDWVVVDGKEENGKTMLRVQRPLVTCDKEHDYPIGVDTNRMIWAISPTNSDTFAYHGATNGGRGPKSLNIIQASVPTTDFKKHKHFTITAKATMPEIDTTYWCTWHKGPVLPKKHHVVAFETLLPNDMALEHTHHYVIFECRAPAGETAEHYFGPLLGKAGDHCHSTKQYGQYVRNCQNAVYTWAKGGKTMVFPVHVGFPIGENHGQATYYMTELHYDNPNLYKGRKIETGVAWYYTDKLRQYDAGILPFGQNVDVSLTVPPNTPSFTVVGHYSSQCSSKTLPKAGVTIFALLQHAHKSGRKMKTRHFRKGVELPWIAHDDNYDFDFQQNKVLPKPVKIMPGDQVTVECVYDSTWKKDSQGRHLAVLGGYSTYEEMCQNLAFYYPRFGGANGLSIYNVEKHFKSFGVTKHTKTQGATNKEYKVTTATVKTPTDFMDFVSHKFTWTKEFLKTYQHERQYGFQDGQCNAEVIPAKYPVRFKEYVPQYKCKRLPKKVTAF